jgi:hypothetical protein
MICYTMCVSFAKLTFIKTQVMMLLTMKNLECKRAYL